jgi:hypothetical protein
MCLQLAQKDVAYRHATHTHSTDAERQLSPSYIWNFISANCLGRDSPFSWLLGVKTLTPPWQYARMRNLNAARRSKCVPHSLDARIGLVRECVIIFSLVLYASMHVHARSVNGSLTCFYHCLRRIFVVSSSCQKYFLSPSFAHPLVPGTAKCCQAVNVGERLHMRQIALTSCKSVTDLMTLWAAVNE